MIKQNSKVIDEEEERPKLNIDSYLMFSALATSLLFEVLAYMKTTG